MISEPSFKYEQRWLLLSLPSLSLPAGCVLCKRHNALGEGFLGSGHEGFMVPHYKYSLFPYTSMKTLATRMRVVPC